MDSPPNIDVPRLLNATRARLIAVGWKRGGIGAPRRDQPACLWWSLRFCAGLVADESPTDLVIETRRALVDELPDAFKRLGLTAWNDIQGRTVDDVLALIDKARAKATVS